MILAGTAISIYFLIDEFLFEPSETMMTEMKRDCPDEAENPNTQFMKKYLRNVMTVIALLLVHTGVILGAWVLKGQNNTWSTYKPHFVILRFLIILLSAIVTIVPF